MLWAGMAWGVYSLLGRRAGDPITATGGNFLRSVPFAALLALSAAGHITADPMGALWAVLSGAVTSGLGYVLWYAALPALRATQAATIQLRTAITALGGAVLLASPSPPACWSHLWRSWAASRLRYTGRAEQQSRPGRRASNAAAARRWPDR